MLARLDHYLEKIISVLTFIGIIALVIMMVLTFLDVTGRTLFGRALTGTVETTTLLMGILVFTGLARTEHTNRHVKVDVLHSLLPNTAGRITDVVNLAAAFFVCGVLTWRLTLSAINIFSEQETTMIWSLPYWPVAMVMVVGLMVFLVTLLMQLLISISHLVQNPSARRSDIGSDDLNSQKGD